MNNYNINVVLCRSRSSLHTYSDGDAQIYQNLIINNSKKLFVLWTRTMTKKKKQKKKQGAMITASTQRKRHVLLMSSHWRDHFWIAACNPSLLVNFSLSMFLCSGTCLKVQSSLVHPVVLQKKHSFLYVLQYEKQVINHFKNSVLVKNDKI